MNIYEDILLETMSISLTFSSYFQPPKMYAKALYDNVADTPDELTFKRGEILNVIEQDTDGLTGWWLCSVRGRQVNTIIFHQFSQSPTGK